MTPPPTRPAAALLAGLALALAGCGTSPPTKSDAGEPADGKGTTPNPVASTPTPPPAGAPAAGPVKPADASHLAAEAFLKDLRAAAGGPVPADLLTRLSPDFLKVIGKPLLSPADTARGYSADAAAGWLGRAAAGLNGVGPPTGFSAASGSAAVFVGSINNGAGRVLLRLVRADAGWKVDWVQLGGAKANDLPAPATADEAFTDFAAVAFLDALTGGGATTRDDRVPLVAAVLSPKLKAAWAEPFGQDKERGYDYSTAKLGQLVDRLAGGATAFARTRTGPDQFRVEITGGDGKPKGYALKLARGDAPGTWLVDEFKPE